MRDNQIKHRFVGFVFFALTLALTGCAAEAIDEQQDQTEELDTKAAAIPTTSVVAPIDEAPPPFVHPRTPAIATNVQVATEERFEIFSDVCVAAQSGCALADPLEKTNDTHLRGLLVR